MSFFNQIKPGASLKQSNSQSGEEAAMTQSQLSTALGQLDTNGWCVVKNVISPEKAERYVNEAYAWLEGFGLGFDRRDRSTWKPENLPSFNKGGLFNRHASGQEQWAWDIRSEPGLIETFAHVWGTEELAVSFDGVNISLPFADDMEVDRAPWAHVDQNPQKRYKHCIQGIMNLYENGPKDGGLMVLDGSFALFGEFFNTHPEVTPPEGWGPKSGFRYTDELLQWFFDKGCKFHKVEAGPGDVILWDSRCIHYGAAAVGDRPRVATYVCYKPARDVSAAMQAMRTSAMENFDNTGNSPMFASGGSTVRAFGLIEGAEILLCQTHDPTDGWATGSRASGKLEENERTKPSNAPILSHRAKQLAGLVAY